EGFIICEKSGWKKACKPSKAPGNVTARITIKRNAKTSNGIKILFAASIPFLTPLDKIPNTITHTIMSGTKTPGTNDPTAPGSTVYCKLSFPRKLFGSLPQLNFNEKYEYDIAQAIITE